MNITNIDRTALYTSNFDPHKDTVQVRVYVLVLQRIRLHTVQNRGCKQNCSHKHITTPRSLLHRIRRSILYRRNALQSTFVEDYQYGKRVLRLLHCILREARRGTCTRTPKNIPYVPYAKIIRGPAK